MLTCIASARIPRFLEVSDFHIAQSLTIHPGVTLDLKEDYSRRHNGEHSDSQMYLEHLRPSVHLETVNNVGLGDAAIYLVSQLQIFIV